MKQYKEHPIDAKGWEIRGSMLVTVTHKRLAGTPFYGQTGLVMDPHHTASPVDGQIVVIFDPETTPVGCFAHLADATNWGVSSEAERAYNADPSVICFEPDELCIERKLSLPEAAKKIYVKLYSRYLTAIREFKMKKEAEKSKKKKATHAYEDRGLLLAI